MKLEETKQPEQLKAQEQVLGDLPVNDEQANVTNGGLNFQNIKFDYRPQDDKDN